jgi:hypothetical protein
MLMLRSITVLIVLHVFEILLWDGFYRRRCFPLCEPAFISLQAVMPPLAMAMSFSRVCGGP